MLHDGVALVALPNPGLSVLDAKTRIPSSNTKEHDVKSILWTIAAIVAVGSVLAESAPAGAHIHWASAAKYRLIDLGTFGGPNSFVDAAEPALMMNSHGVVVGVSDTAAADPHPSSCFNSDCYLDHAFSAAVSGRVTDLGALPGKNSSDAGQISDSGIILGSSQNGTVNPITKQPAAVAVYWIGGKLRPLHGLGGSQSAAMGVNNGRTIVGWALNKTPYTTSIWGNLGTEQRAVLWRPGQKVEDLGTLGGPSAVAYLVNTHGVIAGQADTNNVINAATGSPTADPFLWRKRRMTDLGTLGGTNGSPVALNNRGEVAGQSDLEGDTTLHPFLWSHGRMNDLGTLGGANGIAEWMNNAGHVVGIADLPGGKVHHGFLWRNGKMIDLGVARGKTCSGAFGVNSKDQVVGASGICGGPENTHTGFLWQRGHMIDLNTLISLPASGLRVADGNAINDRGDIAGIGVLPNGDEHVVLLVPRR